MIDDVSDKEFKETNGHISKWVYISLVFMVILGLFTMVTPKETTAIVSPARDMKAITFEKTGIELQPQCEGNWFVWNSELYYIYNDRDLNAISQSMKIVKYDPDTHVQTDIVTIPGNFGMQAAIVEGGVLNVFALDINFTTSPKGNSIYRITSTDLATFSSPAVVYTVPSNTKAWNLGITKNTTTNEFVIDYSATATGQVTFSDRFIKSTNLTTWTAAGTQIGGTWYAGAADLFWYGGYYYAWESVEKKNPNNPTQTVGWEVYLMRSTDLNNWTSSIKYPIQPTELWEAHNTTDINVIYYNGKIYMIYCVSDQMSWTKITYAVFNGGWEDYFHMFYVPLLP